MIDTQKLARNNSEMNVNDGSSSSGGNDGNNGNAVMEKQEKVGSLSFNVIETSKKGSDETENSKPAMKKAVRRAKIPLKKGYSQMDWLRLTKTHPDLAGEDILLKAVGKDCTSLFNKYHAWVNADALLEKCLVGLLGDLPSKQ